MLLGIYILKKLKDILLMLFDMKIIEMKNLGKRYVMGEQQEGYLALRDILVSPFKHIRHKKNRENHNELWALQDINLTIEAGEVVGIIGRNGAGKSTLLKILSQITPPSAGEIVLRGKVGSLLEVGTGFHPELTGRENIYLNGAILGMKKTEIDRKFDEIVDFSGIENFLDTPVKRYSSGMYVRLAFSVAVHLEPDILIVDEVLAVGDIEFQKKCLKKMDEVTKKDGRTVLMVSHNMEAIRKLCERTIFLDKGKLLMVGDTNSVIDAYLSNCGTETFSEISIRTDRRGNGKVRIEEVYFIDNKNNKVVTLSSGSDVTLCCKYQIIDKDINHFNFGFSIDSLPEQYRIAYIGNKITNQLLDSRSGMFKIHIKKIPFNVGDYQYSVICTDEATEIYDWVQAAGQFSVDPGFFYASGKLPSTHDGILLLDYTFE